MFRVHDGPQLAQGRRLFHSFRCVLSAAKNRGSAPDQFMELVDVAGSKAAAQTDSCSVLCTGWEHRSCQRGVEGISNNTTISLFLLVMFHFSFSILADSPHYFGVTAVTQQKSCLGLGFPTLLMLPLCTPAHVMASFLLVPVLSYCLFFPLELN